MGKIKDINIKNRTYYFYDDIINIKDFDPNLLKLDAKSFKNVSIYYIGYITNSDITNSGNLDITNSVNPLYLLVHVIDCSIEGKEGSKYLNITLTDSNSKALKQYAEIWSGIKDWIGKINDGKPGECGKDYMKIKFNSDDDLPLKKKN